MPKRHWSLAALDLEATTHADRACTLLDARRALRARLKETMLAMDHLAKVCGATRANGDAAAPRTRSERAVVGALAATSLRVVLTSLQNSALGEDSTVRAGKVAKCRPAFGCAWFGVQTCRANLWGLGTPKRHLGGTHLSCLTLGPVVGRFGRSRQDLAESGPTLTEIGPSSAELTKCGPSWAKFGTDHPGDFGRNYPKCAEVRPERHGQRKTWKFFRGPRC